MSFLMNLWVDLVSISSDASSGQHCQCGRGQYWYIYKNESHLHILVNHSIIWVHFDKNWRLIYTRVYCRAGCQTHLQSLNSTIPVAQKWVEIMYMFKQACYGYCTIMNLGIDRRRDIMLSTEENNNKAYYIILKV